MGRDRLLVARSISHRGEHGIECAEHRLGLEQLLLITEQQDLSGDERFLCVEFAGRDGDGGRPLLVHPDVLVVGRAGAERGAAVADLEVVRDVALGSVAHDLSDVDLVVGGQLPEVVARGDLRGQSVDPRQAQVSDHGSVVCPIMARFEDARHTDAAIEEWVFAAWTHDGELGLLSGHRIVGRVAWYWAALARAGRPLLHVTDFEVPVRADPFIVKGEALWAEHHCVAPLEQWSIGNETYAAALDDPDEALGRAYGDPTPIAFDLEWYATAPPSPFETGYEQDGVVHGAIEVLGDATIELAEVPGRRWHRWVSTGDRAVGLGPLMLPEAVAHSGVRAPFAFPDGSASDLVLTPRGWNRRAPRRTPEQR